MSREELRATFDAVAQRYDRARPGYPRQLFDDLTAGWRPGSRVLEIGCGTGQATLPLAERGCAVTAVELSAGLAAVARRKLAAFPAVDVVISAFEDWAPPAGAVALFDVVLAATSWHWVDPGVRVAKAAAALRPGGALVTITTHHVAGGTADFFVDVQECYERWDPATPPHLRLPPADEIAADSAELAESGLFGPATFASYERDISYTTAEYLDLLLTYSNHLALRPDARRGLLTCIGNLIDGKYYGRIVKRYLLQTRTAHLRLTR